MCSDDQKKGLRVQKKGLRVQKKKQGSKTKGLKRIEGPKRGFRVQKKGEGPKKKSRVQKKGYPKPMEKPWTTQVPLIKPF